ncbi:MAG: hypothetical protein PHI98_12005 [Eubacteriales bacterium]|nr:hypothetical protein [Eubacteriales bacterium]
MKNKAIYRRTFRFAWLRLLIGLAGIAAGALITMAGYFLTRGMSANTNMMTTGICLVVGIIVFGLMVHYLGYMLKAGQIAMVARAVTEGNLPDDVVAAGKAAVKSRFVTANVYFGLNSAIRAITTQITNGVNALTNMLGGEKNSVAETIGGLVSFFIQIVLEYINYCCLGWVFCHPGESAVKSTCDGAVLYFQNWKALLKNAGKVMAITLVFCIIVGCGLCFLNIAVLENVLPADGSLDAAMLTSDDGTVFTLMDLISMGAILVALLVTGLLHATFVKPYLLVMFMRGYMDAAKDKPVSVDLYGKLCGMSKRFKKLFNQGQQEQAQPSQAM